MNPKKFGRVIMTLYELLYPRILFMKIHNKRPSRLDEINNRGYVLSLIRVKMKMKNIFQLFVLYTKR